jgi:septal ring factor EnvC (AmiA/AmiB activator)
MEGSKSITLTPAVLLSLVLTIIPAAGGIIYKMSANDSKLQNTVDEVKKINARLSKIKKADTSVLLDRIAKLEGIVETQSSQLKEMKLDISEVYDEISDVEESMTSWSEKEFEKLYKILNDNPLGR